MGKGMQPGPARRPANGSAVVPLGGGPMGLRDLVPWPMLCEMIVATGVLPEYDENPGGPATLTPLTQMSVAALSGWLTGPLLSMLLVRAAVARGHGLGVLVGGDEPPVIVVTQDLVDEVTADALLRGPQVLNWLGEAMLNSTLPPLEAPRQSRGRARGSRARAGGIA